MLKNNEVQQRGPIQKQFEGPQFLMKQTQTENI